MYKIAGILFLIGILCLIYMFVIMSYAGMTTAFLWFWPIVGILFIMMSGVIYYIEKKGISISTKVKILVCILLTVGIGVFIFIEGILVFYGNTNPVTDADYMIVLGAQVKGTTVSRTLKYRLDAAAQYLNKNERTIVIVSGGQGNGELITEAEVMKEYLITKGISKERIIEENQSINTNENIIQSKKYIKGGEKRIVIVSNDFHIYRAVAIAKKQGLYQAEGLGAKSDRLMTLHYYVREAMAVVKYKLIGNI